MAVTIEQATTDVGGWNGTITAGTSGNTIIAGVHGTTTADAGSLDSATLSDDGGMTLGGIDANIETDNLANMFFAVAYLHNCGTAVNNFSATSSGMSTLADMALWEVSGLDTGAGVEDSATSTNDEQTSMATGSVTVAGAAFMACMARYEGGAETGHADWTKRIDSSVDLWQDRTVSSGGTYNADWSITSTQDSVNLIFAFGEAAAGGFTGGLSLLGVGT